MWSGLVRMTPVFRRSLTETVLSLYVANLKFSAVGAGSVETAGLLLPPVPRVPRDSRTTDI